ncbi:hypothetical protein ECP03048163_5098 [Escherichia coli P0304816.3]|nr:hypothetical protein ECP03048163_5098 [Escherichia coli P0304816.3]
MFPSVGSVRDAVAKIALVMQKYSASRQGGRAESPCVPGAGAQAEIELAFHSRKQSEAGMPLE